MRCLLHTALQQIMDTLLINGVNPQLIDNAVKTRQSWACSKQTNLGRVGMLAGKASFVRASGWQKWFGTMAIACALPLAAADSNSASQGGAEVHPEQWPTARWPLTPDDTLEARVQSLLAAMSVEHKVGQIVQADINSVTPEEVRQFKLGSILAGGNSAPGGREFATAADWLSLSDAFYMASMSSEGDGPKIPILFGVDAVHGHNNIIGATLYPHNIGLGATRNEKLIGEIAAATARELRATGVPWTFAPTLAVPRDDRWGRTYEGYSEEPSLVARYARAMVEGLQGRVGSDQFLDAAHVAACAKHFLGDGGTYNGRDQGDAQLSEYELWRVHGAGYPAAIDAGVQTVMVSFSSWNGAKVHGHRGLLTDALRGPLNFGGMVVGDWNAHGQVPGCSNEDCPQAFNAGVDLLMAPDSWRGYYHSALARVQSGAISMQRLNEAVSRVLRLKLRLGLFEAGAPASWPLAQQPEQIGHHKHRDIARQAVRQSLVLLKNANGVLPLNPNQRILVAGDGADSMPKQSGGWTLTWQGSGTRRADFPGATTIWEGLSAAISIAGGQADLSPEGNYQRRPDAAIVVFGEDPYAEFQGDIETLEYKPGDRTDLELLQRLKAEGIPTIAVFLSGRPLWVNPHINAADAFIAAWLPGSEGGGIADVLLRAAGGQIQHDFSGRLSFSWPADAMQQVNLGVEPYAPLFAFGYGLRYADDGELAKLDEDPKVDARGGPSGVYFRRGEVSQDWSLVAAELGEPVHAIADLPAQTGAAALRLSRTDYEAQEDALKVSWSGPARVALMAAKSVDLTRQSNGDVMLIMSLRRHGKVPEGVSLGLGCGDGCAVRRPWSAFLSQLPERQWVKAGVPLKCFAEGDLAQVSALYELLSSGPLRLDVADLHLGSSAQLVDKCD